MPAAVLSRARTYASFVKLEHSVFSLPLIGAGLFVGAGGWPSEGVIGWVLLGAVAGRVAAMGINRLIDAAIDRRNPRTQRRELPAGLMADWEGRLVVAAASALYLASAWVLGPLCLALSPIPLALFVVYPYLKRVTPLCHLGLGLAWSMGPLGAWIAGAQSLAGFDRIAWLWAFSILWVTGFDVIYATMDEAFDRAEGLHSLPADLGKAPALAVAGALHVAAIAALAAWWWQQGGAVAVLPWLLGIGGLLAGQLGAAPTRPDVAFFQLNAPVGFLVLGLVLTGAS
jgi:4-hydroxybenzoate polyprenyltransferase